MSEQHEAEDLKTAKKGDVVVVVDPNRAPRRATVESAGPKWITVDGSRYTRQGQGENWGSLRTCEAQRSHDLLHAHHNQVCALLWTRAWPAHGWSCAKVKSAELRPLLERELRVARELAEIWAELDRLESEARAER